MKTRPTRGVTLVELLVVLAILAGMIGLLLPAVQRARASARSAVCQNNLRQLSLAAANHRDLAKEFPVPGESWTITLLQWLEEKPLMEQLQHGNWQAAVGTRPPVYRCPSQSDVLGDLDAALPCHYTLHLRRTKRGKLVPALPFSDRPQNFQSGGSEPWYLGPAEARSFEAGDGPHAGEYHRT